MDRSGRPVNTRRPYDATSRRAQARRNRERIIDTGRELFLRQGYAATTIAAIASRCGVSVDTIYKSFGGKPGLVRAIHERALAGEGPVPAERRSEAIQAEERDPRKIIASWGAFVTEISPRAAPILLLVRAAASSDPELGSLVEELDDLRLRRMTENARRFSDAGHLRPGMTVAEAADVMWTYTSPELYELLVLRRRMTAHAYGRFVSDALAGALLGSERSDPTA